MLVCFKTKRKEPKKEDRIIFHQRRDKSMWKTFHLLSLRQPVQLQRSLNPTKSQFLVPTKRGSSCSQNTRWSFISVSLGLECPPCPHGLLFTEQAKLKAPSAAALMRYFSRASGLPPLHGSYPSAVFLHYVLRWWAAMGRPTFHLIIFLAQQLFSLFMIFFFLRYII